MLYTTSTNAQEEDWQKLDGNENLASNEVFHYHNNKPKLTRKIKYWEHTRKERTHKIQISPNAVLVVHTKDVSCNPLVPDHILSVPVHMKNSTLKLISIQFSFALNLSFYRCSRTLNPEPWT
jgi:hypothetical protein